MRRESASSSSTRCLSSYPVNLPTTIAPYYVVEDGVTQGMKFSRQVKNIAAQEPFADLQDRLVGLAEITERIALERRSVMVRLSRTQQHLRVLLIHTSIPGAAACRPVFHSG